MIYGRGSSHFTGVVPQQCSNFHQPPLNIVAGSVHGGCAALWCQLRGEDGGRLNKVSHVSGHTSDVVHSAEHIQPHRTE